MNINRFFNLYVCSCTLFLILPLQAIAESDAAFKVKAAYLYQFFRYAHWSEDQRTNVIGLVTVRDIKYHFLGIDGKQLNGHEITVKQIYDLEKQLDCCDMLYFAAGTESKLSQWRDHLPAGVVTVADNQLRNGELAMIRLQRRYTKLKFSVYTKNAKRKEVELSSRLLRVALSVY